MHFAVWKFATGEITKILECDEATALMQPEASSDEFVISQVHELVTDDAYYIESGRPKKKQNYTPSTEINVSVNTPFNFQLPEPAMVDITIQETGENFGFRIDDTTFEANLEMPCTLTVTFTGVKYLPYEVIINVRKNT